MDGDGPTRTAPRTGWSAVLPWVGVAVGGVLLARLAVQGLRAVGYSVEWLHDLVLGEFIEGLRFSVVDFAVVAVVATIGVVWALARRTEPDAPPEQP